MDDLKKKKKKLCGCGDVGDFSNFLPLRDVGTLDGQDGLLFAWLKDKIGVSSCATSPTALITASLNDFRSHSLAWKQHRAHHTTVRLQPIESIKRRIRYNHNYSEKNFFFKKKKFQEEKHVHEKGIGPNQIVVK